MHIFFKTTNYYPFLAILPTILLSCVSNNSSKLSERDTSFSHGDTQRASPLVTDIYSSIAMDICDCLQPMIDIVEEFEVSNPKDDEKAMVDQQSRIAQVRPQVESCTENIKIRYEKIQSPETNKKIMNGLKKYCPASYEIINKTMAIKL